MLKNRTFLSAMITSTLLLLCGCTQSTMQLTQRIPSQANIATVATFHNKAYFHNNPFLFSGTDFVHSLPDFHANTIIVKTVNRTLIPKGYKVINLPYSTYEHAPNVELVSAGTHVSATYQKYLLAVMKTHPVDYLVVVTPDRFRDKVGNITYFLPEYGITTRVIFGIKSAQAYASYKMYVINTNNWQIIGSTQGEFSVEIPVVVRQDDYMKIPPATLAEVKAALESSFANNLPIAVQQIGII